jgi:hypothetical protein
MTHILKCEPGYFDAVKSGLKTFELRKNDRDFKVGDKLLLLRALTGMPYFNGTREFVCEIVYILHGGKYGLEEGYCILGIK